MIFDGHGDVWTDVTCRAVDHGERDIFRTHHLHKFQEGGVTGGIFVIWIDPPYDSDPVKRSKQIVKSIKQEMEDSADILNFVKKYDDFEKGTKEGKLNIVTGMEGLSQIGEDIDMINYFDDEVGVRHAMLTWNELNALATGWPVDVTRGHTEAGTMGMELLDILARENVDFSTVALGHLDRNPDEYYLLKLADRGIYIQFDGPGKVKYYPDSIRVALIKSLISHGYADQLLISGDMGRASYQEGYGGGPGFRYIKTKFIPRLLDEGVDEDVIHKIFVENPKRWLAVY